METISALPQASFLLSGEFRFHNSDNAIFIIKVSHYVPSYFCLLALTPSCICTIVSRSSDRWIHLSKIKEEMVWMCINLVVSCRLWQDASRIAGCSWDSGQKWRYHWGTLQTPPLRCNTTSRRDLPMQVKKIYEDKWQKEIKKDRNPEEGLYLGLGLNADLVFFKTLVVKILTSLTSQSPCVPKFPSSLQVLCFVRDTVTEKLPCRKRVPFTPALENPLNFYE